MQGLVSKPKPILGLVSKISNIPDDTCNGFE